MARLSAQLTTKRIAIHFIFWVLVWLFTSFIYGYTKYDLAFSLTNNVLFLPIHILYFYVVSYVIIPKYLFRKRYLLFVITLFPFVFFIPLLNRLLDILVIDPRVESYIRMKGMPLWERTNKDFWSRFTNPAAYLSAFKGANFVIWFAIVIKFFKLWYERHHAALQAELRLLKGQIHPHFLFNTLNNLYALTLNQSPKSPQIVMGLSEILRYMLYECNVDHVGLRKDVEILESYVMLEKLRYEERLDLSFSTAGEIDQHQIAPLLLMLLVENAFKHGTGESVGQVWINIDLTVKHNWLKFKIANGKPAHIDTEAARHFGHIGLENVRKRLQLLYPDAHSLKIFNEEEMFIVILEIELQKLAYEN
ncbi:MAG: histidine kinase [Pedobacter sp.]|nr:histidine kinase [Pedobacter sp.]MDQ8053891.1 histidine kinase [Pedobacter sp.]